MTLTGKTQILAIIGDPIGHSLSPPMQNAALAHLGWDGIYVPFRVKAAELETAIAGLWALGVVGFNVTIPHKQSVMAHLAHVTPLAQGVGAVNTVWRTVQGWAGTNTDVQGFLTPLTGQGRNWQGSRAVVLGNGGAARAVVAGCQQLGCEEIWVVGRDRAKLADFAASWQDSPLSPPLQVVRWDHLTSLLPAATLLVNTTPLGMAPQRDRTPLTIETLAELGKNCSGSPPVVYDLIYNPRPTQLLQFAQSLGFTIYDGVDMLVYQGAAALEQWTGLTAPVAVMRQELLESLEGG